MSVSEPVGHITWTMSGRIAISASDADEADDVTDLDEWGEVLDVDDYMNNVDECRIEWAPSTSYREEGSRESRDEH